MAAAADWQRHARLDRVDRRTDGLLQQGDRAMLTKASAHAGSFIGRPLPRFEDLRFVRGSGNYTDDVSLPDQTYAVFVRAPHAHARIVSIDTSAGRRRPGVIAALVGEDYLADGHIGMAHLPNPADAHDVTMPSFQPTPEREVIDLLHLPLANDCVRFRSEEHTSELQSLTNLVCRLLLEKKKTIKNSTDKKNALKQN